MLLFIDLYILFYSIYLGKPVIQLNHNFNVLSMDLLTKVLNAVYK